MIMIQPPYTTIFLENVIVPVHIGVRDWEKHPSRQWPLKISAELFTRRTDWGQAVIDDVVDYTRIYEHVQGWRNLPHVELLESLGEDLIAACFADRQVFACRVRIAKMQLYPDALAGIEVFRFRDEHGEG